MSKTIIGITGRKGTGKSTLASLIQREIPGSHIVAFADALKDDVADLIAAEVQLVPPIGRVWLDAHKATVFGPILQGYGELYRKAVSEDYWVDVLDSEIEDLDAVIIPDVRYENEAAYIRRNGGTLVAIGGPSRWDGDRRDESHPSEANVDAVSKTADVVFLNEGSVDDLRGFAVFIAERVVGSPALPGAYL